MDSSRNQYPFPIIFVLLQVFHTHFDISVISEDLCDPQKIQSKSLSNAINKQLYFIFPPPGFMVKQLRLSHPHALNTILVPKGKTLLTDRARAA
jgi:hypothetical protein